MTIGTTLRKLRLEKGFSQSHVAGCIGLDQSTYCRIESDKAQPRFQTVLKVADFYQIPLADLYPEVKSVAVL